MRFSETTKAAPTPAGFVVLEPSAYADSWADKPRESVAIGLSPLSEEQAQICKAEAAKWALENYPDLAHDDPLLNEACEDRLVTLAVARATCSPNDARQPFFQCADDDVPEAFRPDTIRRLWDELERITIASSAVTPEVNAEDLAELRDLLSYADKLSMKRGARLRKLLAFCLGELRAVKETLG